MATQRGAALAAMAALAVCLLAAVAGAQNPVAPPGKRSWLEDVDCSHALMPGVEAGGRKFEESQWFAPMLHHTNGKVIPCSGDIHAGDHTLMVVTERRGDGLFITEALPSAGPGPAWGADDGACDKTRVINKEKNHFVAPPVEFSNITLRTVYSRKSDGDQLYLSLECSYNIIPPKKKLEAMQEERRKIALEERKKLDREQREESERQARAEALANAVEEMEEVQE